MFSDEIICRAEYYDKSGIVSLDIKNDTQDFYIYSQRIYRPGPQYIKITYKDGGTIDMLYNRFLSETEDYFNKNNIDTISEKYFG